MTDSDAAEPNRSCLRLRAPLRVPGKRSHLIRSLRSEPRRVRDAVGRHLPGAPMRLGLSGEPGSHGPNSPRGIDAPAFRLPPPREALRRDSPKLEERRRSQRVGTLRTAPSGEGMTGAARRRSTIRAGSSRLDGSLNRAELRSHSPAVHFSNSRCALAVSRHGPTCSGARLSANEIASQCCSQDVPHRARQVLWELGDAYLARPTFVSDRNGACNGLTGDQEVKRKRS